MIRAKKPKKKICVCHNCYYEIVVSPTSVKEKTFELNITEKISGEEITHPITVTATYVECPVCGERLLKQLDTEESSRQAIKGVKLTLLQQQGKKLTQAQKRRLQSIERMLYNTRKNLKRLYWDEIYQSLNQDEEQTGTADQELTLGKQGTSTV